MRLMFYVSAALVVLLAANSVFADDDVESLRQEFNKLSEEYEQRIQALETNLQDAEKKQTSSRSNIVDQAQRSFNPAITVILDGRYAGFDNDPDGYELPGFALGGEAGLGKDGLSLGHSEISASANVDDKFYGKFTVAVADHEGETEVELEEAFIQTLGLGGVTLKAGRFYSGVGYLNEQHEHAWDFADAPLVYRGLFGNQLLDDGLQVSYVAPTNLFLQVAAEALSGRRFPAGGEQDGIGAWSAFANLGGDIGVAHSWQIGLNHWEADVMERTSGGHAHGDGEATETPSFSGNSKINALDMVYKWAPDGNHKNNHFKFQFEYFDRQEDGHIAMLGSDPFESTRYDSDQNGWYAQAVYQFMPQWRTGVRYDRLDSDNTGDDHGIIEEAGLDNEGHTPERVSAMLEWLPSEFSRVRLQVNRDDSYEDSDDQIFLQYTHSLGSHGAHQF